MSLFHRSGKWLLGSRGIILLMSLIMGALTFTTLADHGLVKLPMRPALVLLSSISAVVGLGVGLFGREARAVGWVGATWVAYSGLRGGSWLTVGSVTGLVAWLPGLLLGAVVFARRRDARGGGDDEGRPA